jgi:CBS domain-containing protein
MPDRSISSSLRARDLMQTDVLTVSPETSLLDMHRMFIEEEIHGAPVVDDDGSVRGVISSLDLLRPGADGDAPERLTASDIMTRELVAVSPNTPIAEVAETMREQHVHRVLVIEGRELLGVLTTFDLLRAFARDGRKPVRSKQSHGRRRSVGLS